MGHQQQPYGYRDFTTTASGANMQTFGDTGGHDLFGLQTGMEMLAMAPPSKDSPSHVMMMPVSADVTTLDHGWPQNRLIVDENDSSLRCLFPIQDGEDNNNHNHNQGLSLTLISNTHQTSPHHNHDHHQLGLLKQSPSPSSSSYNNSTFHQYYPASYELRSSVYLMPAQELLNEFCNFGGDRRSPIRRHKSRKLEEDDSLSTSTLLPMDPLSLQRRKSKLLSMLEEVDRRYKRYCEQMRGVVSSFEAVAGEGSAAVYSAMASKAMSRHFRCLRDGIVGQIRETKNAMGEKDPVAPGTTRGETPRLKVLDQCIRQQKAFQQGVESHPWRPQRGLPERSVSILRAWLFEHFLHPYPSDVDKHILARQTGLSRSQVSNWFINARVRLWKPMVEEMYVEETKGNSDSNDDDDDSNNSYQPNTQNPNPNVGATTTTSPTSQLQDQKPQLHIEPDSLSSIVSKRMPTENLKVVDLDFASYSNYDEGSFGNGVSLTLGLQQHSGGGMCLSFSPASQQSLFFSREQILEEEQNLPYRKLMGAQLLHDFAG